MVMLEKLSKQTGNNTENQQVLYSLLYIIQKDAQQVLPHNSLRPLPMEMDPPNSASRLPSTPLSQVDSLSKSDDACGPTGAAGHGF
jgi:hypothetical protein